MKFGGFFPLIFTNFVIYLHFCSLSWFHVYWVFTLSFSCLIILLSFFFCCCLTFSLSTYAVFSWEDWFQLFPMVLKKSYSNYTFGTSVNWPTKTLGLEYQPVFQKDLGFYFSYLTGNTSFFFTLDIFLVICFLTSTKPACNCYYFFRVCFQIFSMRWTLSLFGSFGLCSVAVSSIPFSYFLQNVFWSFNNELFILTVYFLPCKISCFVSATCPPYSVQ